MPAFMRPPFGSYNGATTDASLKQSHSQILQITSWPLLLTVARKCKRSVTLAVRFAYVVLVLFGTSIAATLLVCIFILNVLPQKPIIVLGVTPAESKQKYTNIANQRPSTILTLNHETYGKSSIE
jgi:hypothetical protein